MAQDLRTGALGLLAILVLLTFIWTEQHSSVAPDDRDQPFLHSDSSDIARVNTSPSAATHGGTANDLGPSVLGQAVTNCAGEGSAVQLMPFQLSARSSRPPHSALSTRERCDARGSASCADTGD